MRAPLAAIALLGCVLGACRYQPRVPPGVLTCDPARPECPGGLVCRETGGAGTWLCDRPGVNDADLAPADASFDVPAPPETAPTAGDADAGSDDAPVDAELPGRAEAGLAPDGPTACPSGKGPAMIHVGSFCIDSTEVTNRQYQAFVRDPGVGFTLQPAICMGRNLDFKPDPKDGAAVDNPARLDHPVVNVDWCDAAAFCRWAGKRLCGKIGGGPIALGDATAPALSQWAFACTRGGTRRYPWGDAPRATACNVGKTEALPIKTAPVKSHTECEGGFDGLFDMMGNAEEWIDGCREDPVEGLVCGIIGGAYLDTTQGGRCDNNLYDDPLTDDWRARSFRCCSP